MTVPFPLDAFDHAHVVARRKSPVMDRGKLISIGITVAIHVAVAVGLLTAVHVKAIRMPTTLTVQVSVEKPKTAEDVAPPPRLAQPTIVTMAMPDVVVQNPAPVMVQQVAVSKPAPPPPVAAARAAPGESRETFLGKLLAQLNRFKQYPRSARQARIEGVVMLHFVMDAQGKVLSYEVSKSSGRPVLDAEALALIQRAQPLPPIPADYPTRTLDAIVPVEFYLDRR